MSLRRLNQEHYARSNLCVRYSPSPRDRRLSIRLSNLKRQCVTLVRAPEKFDIPRVEIAGRKKKEMKERITLSRKKENNVGSF